MPSTYVRIFTHSCRYPQFEHTLYTSSIYTHILLRHIHVIIMSYLKCCCVLMWYYVFAIKIKYYERKKARHIAIHLHCYYDYSIFPSIHIVFSKKSHFTIRYTDIKKETCTVFFVEPIWLVDFSFLHKIILKIIYT